MMQPAQRFEPDHARSIRNRRPGGTPVFRRAHRHGALPRRSGPPGRRTPRPWSRGEDPFFVSVRGDDPDELAAAWERLSEGATVIQPLGPSAWAGLYGILKDRFGVTWVLDLAA
ncbi:VOC family protein [Glycomyces paridis]|uniref:VOC family protein n=1 Tax=Glycomyces paridis TaxID=2126555 RepID=UPI0030842F62